MQGQSQVVWVLLPTLSPEDKQNHPILFPHREASGTRRFKTHENQQQIFLFIPGHHTLLPGAQCSLPLLSQAREAADRPWLGGGTLNLAAPTVGSFKLSEMKMRGRNLQVPIPLTFYSWRHCGPRKDGAWTEATQVPPPRPRKQLFSLS